MPMAIWINAIRVSSTRLPLNKQDGCQIRRARHRCRYWRRIRYATPSRPHPSSSCSSSPNSLYLQESAAPSPSPSPSPPAPASRSSTSTPLAWKKRFSIIKSALTAENLPLIPIECIHCDVTSPSSITEAYASVKEKLGRIDYGVHCAGIITFGAPSTVASVEDFDRQNNINYRGLWLCSRAAIGIMVGQSLDCDAYPEQGIKSVRAQKGSIVNISSGLARLSMKACPAYCGAKAGVCALTRSDAIDYVEERIRVVSAFSFCTGVWERRWVGR